MQQLKNDFLIKAIKRQPLPRTPVWFMRQAGRYLPEYRATRAKAGSFMKLCKTPELACEVTLQPLKRFPLDAAIIFSDILTIPDAMGLGLQFVEGEGPLFTQPIQSENDIKDLPLLDAEQLQYVYEAIQLVRHELGESIPLIGFCGSPWTLAAYMVEGKANPGFPKLQNLMQEAPLLLHHLLNHLAEAVALHLAYQIKAGAQIIMLFDTWGSLLAKENYLKFSLAYVQQVLFCLKQLYSYNETPVIFFAKGIAHSLEEIAESGCDVMSIDWQLSLNEARKRVGDRVSLQGNLNPAHLLLTPECIRNEVAAVLQSYGKGSGHIFNLGHGITPDVPLEHVAICVEAVHELSPSYHHL